jgi:hypothetical protein
LVVAIEAPSRRQVAAITQPAHAIGELVALQQHQGMSQVPLRGQYHLEPREESLRPTLVTAVEDASQDLGDSHDGHPSRPHGESVVEKPARPGQPLEMVDQH